MRASSGSQPLLGPLISSFSGFKHPLADNEPLSVVPAYANTLSSSASADSEREQLYPVTQRDHPYEEFESMELLPSSDYDDSGYAEFETDIEGKYANEPESEVIQTREYMSRQHPLYRRDSSMLYLDTPPAPSSSGPFGDIGNQSQVSASTSSLGLSFSDYSIELPQVFNAQDPFTTPPPFAKRHFRRVDDISYVKLNMPFSSAPEPPPATFCLPSPMKGPASVFFPQSQATVSDLSDILQGGPDLSSPFQPTISPSPIVPEYNLLDEPDPWDAIGKLLKLPTALRSSTLSQSTTWEPNLSGSVDDRSGVGYIPTPDKNHLNGKAEGESGLLSDVGGWTSFGESRLGHVQVWPEPPKTLSSQPLAPDVNGTIAPKLTVSPPFTTASTPDTEVLQTGIHNTGYTASTYLGESPAALKSTRLVVPDGISSIGFLARPTSQVSALTSTIAACPSPSDPTSPGVSPDNDHGSINFTSDIRVSMETADFPGPCLFLGLDKDDE